MIIEEKQTAEDSGDWATRAKQCIEDMEARRSKKLPQRELNRQLKEGNYAALAECVPLSALAALADSPDRPEDPADPLRAAVEALLREAQQLRQKIEAEAGAELSEARARELLVETIKARVIFQEVNLLTKRDVFVLPARPDAQEGPELAADKAEEPKIAEMSLKDLQTVLSGKKTKKKLEDGLAERLLEARPAVEALAARLAELLAGPFHQVRAEEVARLRLELRAAGLQVDELDTLELKAELGELVAGLAEHLAGACGAMQEEPAEAPSARLKALAEGCLQARFGALDAGLLAQTRERAADLAKRLKLKDESLKEALEKVDALVWLRRASDALESEIAELVDFEELKARAPKSLHYSDTFLRLCEKFALDQSKSAEASEKDVHAALTCFLNKGSDVALVAADMKKYVDRTKKKQTNERVDKLLAAAEAVIELFETGGFSEAEKLVDSLFELKLFETKIVQQIEDTQKNIERVTREAQAFLASCNKVKKSAEKQKHKCILSAMREAERPDLAKAKDLLQQIHGLPSKARDSLAETAKVLKQKVDGCDKFKLRLKELKGKYVKSKAVPGKVDSLVSEFEKLVKEYCQLDFNCEDYRREIEKYVWFVKANSLLDGKPYDGSGRTLDSWKKVLENIKEWGGALVQTVEKKLQTARNFVKEVERIRQAQNSPKGEKEKLPTLQEVDALLKDISKNAKEIDVAADKSFLEGVVSGVQSKLRLRNEPSMMLHDLQNCLEYCRRAPLNLREELAHLLEVEKRASDFLLRVRELAPEGFVQKQAELQLSYETLGVKVMEWEDMIGAVTQEEKIIGRIHENLKSAADGLELADIQDIREQYKNIRYLKDLRLEIKLMLAYLQSLRIEFERRQDSLVREESLKPAIDYVMLGALISELDDLTYRMKTSEPGLKGELMALNDNNKFTHDLHNEVKRYLEYQVYTMNLESINFQPLKKMYKKFVDLTGPILDFKINLEIQEREKNQFTKSHFLAKDNPKRQALVLESKYSREEEAPPAPAGQYGFAQTAQTAAAFPERKLSGTGSGKNAEGNPKSNNPFREESESAPIKPTVSRNSINQDLRTYYCKIWKKLMESNPYLDISGLDALMASKTLEKNIYDKVKKSPVEYDVLCTSVTNALRHISGFKNISTHIRNEAFKPNVLIGYCDKPLSQLRKLEFNLRNGDPGNPGLSGQGSHLKKRPYAREPAGLPAEPGQLAAEEQPAAQEEVSYKNYNIYTGSFLVEEADKAFKPFEEVTLMTCSGYERITQFTEVPKKLTLSTKIEKSYFHSYISEIIEKPGEYKFLTGWITYKKSHSAVNAHLTAQEVVASQQYSKNCKVFIFPVNFLNPDWLSSIPIYTTTAKIEMMFVLVFKKKSDTSEVHISPKVVPLTSMIAYRFVSGSAKIGLRQASLDKIRETAKPAIMGSFGDQFNDEDEEEDEHLKKLSEKAARSKKLQFLIDQGDQIKKVPTSLIEEEARIERSKAAEPHYEEESIDDEEDDLIKSYGNYSQAQLHDRPAYLPREQPGYRPAPQPKAGHFEDKTNFAPYSSVAGIDKEAFVRKAVSLITIPPVHQLLGLHRHLGKSPASKPPLAKQPYAPANPAAAHPPGYY